MQYEEMVASWSLEAPTIEGILLTHLAFSEPHSVPTLRSHTLRQYFMNSEQRE